MSADPIRDVVAAREAALPRPDVGFDVGRDLDVLAAANGQPGEDLVVDDSFVIPGGGEEGELSPEAEAEPASVQAVFVSAREFLALDLPKAEPILGRPGDIILARGSLLLVVGPEGAAKSTLTLDGVTHLAAGRDWLGIPVARPVRVCLIENEGPGGLFQEKLKRKAETWESDDWLDNVSVYSQPWGRYTFANASLRVDLMDFCDAHGAELVVGNPLLGLGVAASGKPDETALAVSWLEECGLWTHRAFWLSHHNNKAGQISGDWGRHPDTVVLLEQDGDHPRTRLTWHKTRWARVPSDARPKKQLLEWVVETEGYKVLDVDLGSVSDDVLRERLEAFLAENPGSSKKRIYKGVKGNQERLRELLDEGLEDRRYAMKAGDRNAQAWSLAADRLLGAEDTVETLEGFQHE